MNSAARARLTLMLAALACVAPQAGASDGAVATNVVRSERSPALTLKISSAFTELAPLRFPIESLTMAERRIFVEANADGRARRMVVIQFETVQTGSDFRFLFPSTPPRRFGAQTYRAGAFVYDDDRQARAEPTREAGRTRAHLVRHGYAPPRFWRVGRLARVSDPRGMSEVIIFYMEAIAAPTAAARESVIEEALQGEEREAMLDRLASAITVISG